MTTATLPRLMEIMWLETDSTISYYDSETSTMNVLWQLSVLCEWADFNKIG